MIDFGGLTLRSSRGIGGAFMTLRARALNLRHSSGSFVLASFLSLRFDSWDIKTHRRSGPCKLNAFPRSPRLLAESALHHCNSVHCTGMTVHQRNGTNQMVRHEHTCL